MRPMVLMLAYNAEKTLERTFESLPASLKPHVVVGDDCSADGTREVATRLGLRVVRHERNLNYGGNLKRLFRLFLEEGADVAVELHADYQYDPALADLMVEYVGRGYFDFIQANRIRSRAECLAGGMPLSRYLGNRVLTLFENLWFGTTFGEWHSGLRAYAREVVEALPIDTYGNTHAFAARSSWAPSPPAFAWARCRARCVTRPTARPSTSRDCSSTPRGRHAPRSGIRRGDGFPCGSHGGGEAPGAPVPPRA